MEKGLVHIYTGEGKSKTTAAIGLSVRAAGSGLKVLFVQFFKPGADASGESVILSGAGVEMKHSDARHPHFTGETADSDKVKNSVGELFGYARERVMGGAFDLLVLDEAMAAVNGGWLGLEEMLNFLDERPPGLEVVLTGRNAPMELVRRADYVTEMLKIKHPFDRGIKARRGVEF